MHLSQRSKVTHTFSKKRAMQSGIYVSLVRRYPPSSHEPARMAFTVYVDLNLPLRSHASRMLNTAGRQSYRYSRPSAPERCVIPGATYCASID